MNAKAMHSKPKAFQIFKQLHKNFIPGFRPRISKSEINFSEFRKSSDEEISSLLLCRGNEDRELMHPKDFGKKWMKV